jgi:hypothetical protein
MIFFVFHAFNCVLRSLVIQLTISSLLLYAGHSIHPLLEIHSIVSHSSFGYHSIGPSFLNHSIDSIIFLHSIDSSIMPVVTRSMAKSVILLDSTVPASSLVTQDQLVSPSSLLSCFECGSDLPSSLVFQIPKISKFRNFKRNQCSSLHFQHHNFHSVSSCNMEPDGVDCSTGPCSNSTMSTQDEIMKMLNAISQQMVQNYQDIQARLDNTELRLSQEIHRISLDQEDFKRETRHDIESIIAGNLSVPVTSTTDPQVPTPTTTSQPDPVLSSSSSNALLATTSSSTSSYSSSTADFQLQMMTMLTETFSKLSTVISDKGSESKGDWPKFSGETKTFRSWYLAILAQLSISPWLELYDTSINDVVQTTNNSTLNGKLYAKLLTCLESQVLQHMVSRKHIRGNGLFLLKELVQTYKPRNVPEVVAAKTGEFWSHTKRAPHETVDAYYNRFHDLLDDLTDADEPISTKAAIRHFIFTLGAEFAPIQNNFRIGLLPVEWQTQDWPSLLALCRDYSNSVNPQGLLKKESSNDGGMSQADRAAWHKKVKQWFSNPTKYKSEMAAAQKLHNGKCLYHLTKSHATQDCYIKKDCEKSVQDRKDGDTKPSATGHLRHITEQDTENDAIEPEDMSDAMPIATGNDTNEDDLYYFARMSNHYLRLVKSGNGSSSTARHLLDYPIIADSGANFHMFKEPEFFLDMKPFEGSVILGDGTTKLPIQGIGTVSLTIDNHSLIIPDVRFVPTLSESVYSLLQHIRQPNHGLQSSFETGLHISFPGFSTAAIIGPHDIYLNAKPTNTSTGESSYSSSLHSTVDAFPSVCRHILQETSNDVSDPKDLDNLLKSLRQYYDSVRTKRQHNLQVPAGFRPTSQLQQMFHNFTPPRKARSEESGNITDNTDHPIQLLSHLSVTNEISPALASIDVDNISIDQDKASPSPTTDASSGVQVPILRCVDKMSLPLPSRLTVTEDFIRASVGFRRIDSIKQHLSTLYQDTISIDSLPPDAVMDLGDCATLRKSPRNTTPVPRPSTYGDVIHMDIVFGPDVSVGNIHYGLIFTDRYSRMTYIYPLQNLTFDIKKQLEAFFAHLGFSPKRLISDFDTKLIGGQAREYLNALKIHVNAAPAYRQDKNGLVERHWQTLVAMARNWLASAELPASFWFYAVRRASEVCNYFPTKLPCGTWSTPLELAHNIKPDLRLLFKPFSVAAVRRERQEDKHLKKFEPQSTSMILLGRCPNSSGLQFYNPRNGTFVSSIDYKIQPNVTCGAHFGYKYQPGLFIYRLDESTSIFAPKFALESTVLVHTHSPPSRATVIGIPTYDYLYRKLQRWLNLGVY